MLLGGSQPGAGGRRRGKVCQAGSRWPCPLSPPRGRPGHPDLRGGLLWTSTLKPLLPPWARAPASRRPQAEATGEGRCPGPSARPPQGAWVQQRARACWGHLRPQLRPPSTCPLHRPRADPRRTRHLPSCCRACGATWWSRLRWQATRRTQRRGPRPGPPASPAPPAHPPTGTT